jgi:hypothetical protein
MREDHKLIFMKKALQRYKKYSLAAKEDALGK